MSDVSLHLHGKTIFVTNDRIRLVSAVAFLFASLCFSYITEISRNWHYLGFNLEPNGTKLLISICTLSIFGLSVRLNNDLTTFYKCLCLLLVLCPASVLFYLGDFSYLYYFNCVAGLTIVFLVSNLSINRIYILVVSPKLLLIIMAIGTSVGITAIIAYGGLAYFNLDLLDVYEGREAVTALLPAILGYLNSSISKVFIPLAIVVCIFYKKRIALCIFIVFAILLFGLTHHKSVLVGPIVAYGFTIFLQRFSVVQGVSYVFFLTAFIIVGTSTFQYLLEDASSNVVSGFFVRRMFMMPALLDSYHIDFFSENTFTYWSRSSLSFGLIESDYYLNTPFLIGDHFFEQDGVSANTGFIGSGFANFGVLGVMIYGVAIGLVLASLNAISRRLGTPFVVAISVFVVVSIITSADFVTAILSHGLLSLLVLLSLIPADRKMYL